MQQALHADKLVVLPRQDVDENAPFQPAVDAGTSAWQLIVCMSRSLQASARARMLALQVRQHTFSHAFSIRQHTSAYFGIPDALAHACSCSSIC